MANTKLTFKIMSFEGGPSLTHFFFTQIRTLAKTHKQKHVKTIQFIGSKLTGAARVFFPQNANVYESVDLDYVEKEFRTFVCTSEQDSRSCRI